jgi:NAD(P)-dependent dehydrogenase (short-subunit alcohol dehydrogenase family)
MSKVVLVKSATRGLGRGIARGFGQIGVTVAITGRTPPP